MDPTHVSCQVAYLLPHKDHLVAELGAAGVEAVCLEAGSEWDVRWAGRLRRLVGERGIDIVHIHAPYPAAVARPVLRSLGRRRPAIVYTEHNAWGGYSRVTRWANALTYRLDDARMAVSADALGSIPPILRGTTEVVVHGVDLDAVGRYRARRKAARAALGVGDDTVLVGTVANLRRHKDYPNLLRAARVVLDASVTAGFEVVFVAVGQGPLEGEIRAEAVRLGLGESFRLLGYHPDPLEVLAGCDIFTLASMAEGYPVALMEALALGLPVVATDVGGIPDALRSGIEGLLVPPSRPDLLGEALVVLAGDATRRAEMGEAAALRSGLFDIRRAAARIEAIYEQVRR